MKGYKDQMEKIFISKYCKKQFWFVFFLLCLFTFFSHYLALLATKNGITLLSYFPSTRDPCPTTMNFTDNPVSDKKDNRPKQVQDSCLGQYIYVHDLPSRFNVDILKNCSSLIKWFNMCESLTNFGLGPEVKNSGNVLQNTSWYVTNQFVLDIIFHEKMKRYKCLTNDSSLASAIFVPYYAGLDVGRYLWDGYNTSVRDANPLELTKWLARKPEWRKMEGRDHFFVAGRVSWDFNRQSDNNSDWGNRLMSLPEVKNMTMLIIESRPWGNNEFAVPYPTYFHASTDGEIFEWQKKVQNSKRPYLFSFVGAPRPKMLNSIRRNIINQCLASGRKCTLLDCKVKSCDNPIRLMKMFQQSRFCLQPSGDSYTRRSTFDSILAGCIPVFFHPGSAYIQYMWHLPKNHRKYSVFIPEEGLGNGTVNIEEILGGISEDEVEVMREEVIRLIPRVIYSDPRSSLGTVDDAFDIAVRKVVERIEGIRSKMKGRGNSSVDFLEPKKIGSEWEHFF